MISPYFFLFNYGFVVLACAAALLGLPLRLPEEAAAFFPEPGGLPLLPVFFAAAAPAGLPGLRPRFAPAAFLPAGLPGLRPRFAPVEAAAAAGLPGLRPRLRPRFAPAFGPRFAPEEAEDPLFNWFRCTVLESRQVLFVSVA